jgi:hypothetical protein
MCKPSAVLVIQELKQQEVDVLSEKELEELLNFKNGIL